MVLGEGQARRVERTRLQPLIDIAREGEGGLDAGVERLGVEGLEPLLIEPGQVLGNPHQPAQIGLGLSACRDGQGRRVLDEPARRRGQGGVGLGKVEPLGRGQDDQHDGRSGLNRTAGFMMPFGSIAPRIAAMVATSSGDL